jgi:hypothetical protein
MPRRRLYVLCALLAAGCFRGGQSPGGANPPEFDVYEAVVRHLVKPLETSATAKHPVVYVSLPEGLSAEAFCQRFKGEAVAVVPFSDGVQPGPNQVAYMLTICLISDENVEWQGSDNARILVRHYAAAEVQTCGTPYPVTLRREGNKWVVDAR